MKLRTSGRRAGLIAVLGVMTLVIVGGALVADGSETGLRTRVSVADPSPTPDWRVYESAEHGFSVRYSLSWTRAEEVLTPNLEDPREILSLGTFTMTAGGDNCAHFAEHAVASMGSEDAFVSIQEREGNLAGPDVVNREARPLTLEDGYETELRDCLEAPATFTDRLIPFHDSGRWFYAFVALGSDVSDDTVHEVEGILDGLSFEEG
jgi:hypothetical protein